MGKIYARLIYKYQIYGTDTTYHCIADVQVRKPQYVEATRAAYLELFGVECP